jgi:hypothetical protein
MNKARLLACPSCARHVRATEPACPFCAALLPDTFAAAPAPRAPKKRLNRAALYAFGATSITVATACSSGGGTTGDVDGSADASPDHGGVTPLYGAPAPDGGIFVDASELDGSAAPLYGAAPHDASVQDGSAEDGGVATPAYGASFPDGGTAD